MKLVDSSGVLSSFGRLLRDVDSAACGNEELEMTELSAMFSLFSSIKDVVDGWRFKLIFI